MFHDLKACGVSRSIATLLVKGWKSLGRRFLSSLQQAAMVPAHSYPGHCSGELVHIVQV